MISFCAGGALAAPICCRLAWISSDQEATYALIQLRAPDEVPVEKAGRASTPISSLIVREA